MTGAAACYSDGALMSSPVRRNHLVAALHERGVCYLAPTPQGDEPKLSDAALIEGLALSDDARLRFALAALVLRRPELAAVAAQWVDAAPGRVRNEVCKQCAAAVYLQRMWRTRLEQALGPSPLLPNPFTPVLGLPDPANMHGKLGLATLTDGSRFNDWSSYEQVVDMLCDQPCASPPEDP